MRPLEQLYLETVLSGRPVHLESLDFARELRRVANLHSDHVHSVTQEGDYFVVRRLPRPGMLQWSGEPEDPRTYEVAASRLRGTDTGRITSGVPPVTEVERPCADCTTEAAVYRAIPIDEVTLEFAFIKSRKFLGGPTQQELDELGDEVLAAHPFLDYAEIVMTRDRKAFEASCGDRLRYPPRKPAGARVGLVRGEDV